MKMTRFEKLFVNSPFHRRGLRKRARALLQLGGDVRGGRVLEVGCGAGFGVEILFDLFGPAYVEAFDVDPDQVRLAQKRLQAAFGDKVRLYEAGAEKIPCPDGSFDAVFELNVLHHIHDNQSAVKEIARVLKPGGRFFFQEILSPLTKGFLMRLFVHHPHEGQFTWEELKSKLATAGLNVGESSSVADRYRVIGVARKKP